MAIPNTGIEGVRSSAPPVRQSQDLSRYAGIRGPDARPLPSAHRWLQSYPASRELRNFRHVAVLHGLAMAIPHMGIEGPGSGTGELASARVAVAIPPSGN